MPAMNKIFINRLLHLVNERPQQGKRMLGWGSNALWELWQRIEEKEHTRKNQVITLPKGTDLVDVVLGEKGPRSDSKLFEQTQEELPKGLCFVGDCADVGRQQTLTPQKRLPKGKLTPEQKEFNRAVSQLNHPHCRKRIKEHQPRLFHHSFFDTENEEKEKIINLIVILLNK